MEIYGSRSSNAGSEFNALRKDSLESDGEAFYINGTPAVKSFDEDFVCAYVITYSDNYVYYIDIETEDIMDCEYLLHLLTNDFYFMGGKTSPVPYSSSSTSSGSSSVNSAGSASSGSSSSVGSAGPVSSGSSSVGSAGPVASGTGAATTTLAAPTTQASASSAVTSTYVYSSTTSPVTTPSTNATTVEPTVSIVYETVHVSETSVSEESKETTNNILKIGIIIFVLVALAALIIGIVEIVSSKKKKKP